MMYDRKTTIRERVTEVSNLLKSHAGGLELVDVSDSGVVSLRFTGMCTGCPLKPLTMAGTVRPAFLAIAGVVGVEAEGSRTSVEAEERLARYFNKYGSRVLQSSLLSRDP
jgi:Fe-S cluster biogenesis protein NfuA